MKNLELCFKKKIADVHELFGEIDRRTTDTQKNEKYQVLK